MLLCMDVLGEIVAERDGCARVIASVSLFFCFFVFFFWRMSMMSMMSMTSSIFIALVFVSLSPRASC